MAPQTATETHREAERPEHAERLRVPWWWWPVGLLIALAAAAELNLGVSGPLGWLSYAITVAATLLGLAWLGRLRVCVEAGELRVDDARLPVEFIADAIPVDAAGRRELLGASADPLAFVVVRPWISGAVQVVLDDPDDPTPYWVISSRQPRALAAELAGLAATGRQGRTTA